MNCCICGAVKNCAPFLNKVFENVEKIGSLFDDYKIILYYDQSSDNTLEILKQYKEKNPRLMFYNNKFEVSKFRTHRIAHARNECIKMFYTNYSNYPYFIMMDFDDVSSQDVKIDVLKKHLHTNAWDALSFNKSHYYDIWALSIKPYFISFRHFDPDLLDEMKNYITNKLNNLPKNKLVKCCSAFNGFSIYRTSKFVNCYYHGSLRLDLVPKNFLAMSVNATKKSFKIMEPGTESSIIEDCEHRAFHLMGINNNGARIRISPEILF